MWLHGDPTKIIISNSLSLPKKKKTQNLFLSKGFQIFEFFIFICP